MSGANAGESLATAGRKSFGEWWKIPFLAVWFFGRMDGVLWCGITAERDEYTVFLTLRRED